VRHFRGIGGLVLLSAVAALVPAAAAEVPAPQQISVDPLANETGQHETAVEPDSFAFGNTVVAAFQVGRTMTAGASGIGWASSADGGTTWRMGLLPSLTVHGSPPGLFTRASDPAVAYDAVHRTWLISVLALRDGPTGSLDELLSSLVVSRSSDGVSWSAPLVTAPEQKHYAHDKNWIVCDNGPRSPYQGRCYVTWTAVVRNDEVFAVAVSSDGGLTWGPPVLVNDVQGSGWQPLVRPDGTLVVVFVTSRAVEAVRSRDGGRTFTRPVVVAALRDSPTRGLRAPSLPSAEVDASGRIVVAWLDCRFRVGCGQEVTANDVVLSSSTDGRRWTRVRRVPTGSDLDGLPHLLAGLAVDPSTRGTEARLAIAFYAVSPRGCSGNDCLLAPFFVSSLDAGQGWTQPEQLAPAQPLDAFPATPSGRFVGDYISTSFVSNGNAVPVFATASRSFDGRYHQGIFATTVPLRASTPVLRVGAVRVVPRRPRSGERVAVSVSVEGLTAGLRLGCRVGHAVRRMQLLRRSVTARTASCIWRLRRGRAGQLITGTIVLTTPEVEAVRRFSLRSR
jgi:hypothetical protein